MPIFRLLNYPVIAMLTLSSEIWTCLLIANLLLSVRWHTGDHKAAQTVKMPNLKNWCSYLFLELEHLIVEEEDKKKKKKNLWI